MIYLASPYSSPHANVMQQRFEAVCRAAAVLMRAGYMVFSPIAHSHPIAQHGLPLGWEFWQAFDFAFIDVANEVWVLTLPGWHESVGVRAETAYAIEQSKPVWLAVPTADHGIQKTPLLTGWPDASLP